MSNAERQRRFRARNPGYFKKYYRPFVLPPGGWPEVCARIEAKRAKAEAKRAAHEADVATPSVEVDRKGAATQPDAYPMALIVEQFRRSFERAA